MANTTNANWDENSPANVDAISPGALEIRVLRGGVADRFAKEHVHPAASGVGGDHLEGSARIYVAASAPTTKPDGSTALDANDEGRVYVNSTTGLMQYYTGSTWTTINSSLSRTMMEHRQNAGVDGGTFTSGDWRTRVLNTKSTDTVSICSLDSGTGIFTLGAGRYVLRAWAIGYRCDAHKIRLQNTTDATTIWVGSSAVSPAVNGIPTVSQLVADFTLTATKSLALQHQCQTTRSTDGFGIANAFSGAIEVYSAAELTRILG